MKNRELPGPAGLNAAGSFHVFRVFRDLNEPGAPPSRKRAVGKADLGAPMAKLRPQMALFGRD
jgi:hypothetical protein